VEIYYSDYLSIYLGGESFVPMATVLEQRILTILLKYAAHPMGVHIILKGFFPFQ
jgi:hypothetical protein